MIFDRFKAATTFLLVGSICLLMIAICSAQPPAPPPAAPKTQFADPPEALDSKANNAVKAFLSGKSTDASSIPAYCKYLMANFTEVYGGRDSRVPKFAAIKSEINTILTSAGLTKEGRAVLVKELCDVCEKYLADDQLPDAAKINAIYVLAELDQTRDLRTGERTPYNRATGILLRQLEAANVQNIYRIAALSAFERHVRDGWKNWEPPLRQRLTKSVVKYAINKPVDDGDRAVNTWIVRRALDVLRVMESPEAIDAAIGYLANANEFPSLRASALEYLTSLDPSKLQPAQKKSYALGLIHYFRSQVVAWYEMETDMQNRSSGRTLASSGMSSGPDSGESSFDPSMGEDFGGPIRASGGNRPRPVDSQDWKTRLARRRLNELSQLVHRSLDGKRVNSDSGAAIAKFNLASDNATATEYKLTRLIQLVENFQTAINDPVKVTTIGSLLGQSRLPIEEIMDFAKKSSGFLEKYPELKNENDLLEEVVDPAAESPPAGDAKPAADQPKVDAAG